MVATAFGGALLPVAAVLWRESERSTRTRLQLLAAGNAATGTLLCGWLAARRAQTGALGRLTIAITGVALIALAAAQARAAPKLG